MKGDLGPITMIKRAEADGVGIDGFGRSAVDKNAAVLAEIMCRSSRPTQTYPKVALALDSCFIEAGFTLILQSRPEPSSPQAFTVELTA